MKPTAETYVDLFEMNFRAIRALCRDVTEEEARKRPDGRRNPMLWIAGHIATYRAEALSRLGAPDPRGESLRSSFGRDVQSDPASWPALAAVLSELADFHAALVERLRAAGDAAFDATVTTPAGQTVPAIVFLHFHESYHLGQLGYVRTWLGKSPLVRPGSGKPPA
jgi:hypothetical protein